MNKPSYHKIRIEIEGNRIELYVNEMPIPVRSLDLSASTDAFPVIMAEIVPGIIPPPRDNLEALRTRAESALQIYYTEKILSLSADI